MKLSPQLIPLIPPFRSNNSLAHTDIPEFISQGVKTPTISKEKKHMSNKHYQLVN